MNINLKSFNFFPSVEHKKKKKKKTETETEIKQDKNQKARKIIEKL